MRHTLLTAAFFSALLVLWAHPCSAQIFPISFPDTVVGSTSTIKCPTTTVGLCFGGENCLSSGTVQNVSGPNAPFAVGKFNLLSRSQFFAGNCEANPVILPVPVGADQILAFQATFAPSAPGLFSGSMTFSTSGGPLTLNLSGTGTSPPNTKSGRGLISVETNKEDYVPGDFLDLSYHTSPGTLQGNVDLYFAVQMPDGQLLFVTASGGLTPAFEPFRTNVTVVDETRPFLSIPVPLDLPFGAFTCFMAMGFAGVAPDPNNLQLSLASAIAEATLNYAPLSPVQQSILQSRGGNPDLLAIIWYPDLSQNRQSWLYLSNNPFRFTFLNGNLEHQEVVSNATGGPGPKIDPSLLTPQSTLGQLTAAFGSPTSVAPVPEAPEFQGISYSFGLDVTLLDGRLSSATTSIP